MRLCGADKGFIVRPDRDLYRTAAAYGATPEFLEVVHRNPITPSRQSATGRAILERRAIQIPDVLADPEYGWAAGQRGEEIRTILAVPMLREATVIGVIVIRRTKVEPFSKQIELVKTFADQAVIAIENVRLFNELRERTAELTRSVAQLTALGEVSRAVSSTLDVEAVLDTIVSRASSLAGADGCARSLATLDVLGLYLDALALRVRSAGKVVSVPVLGVVAVLTDGQKQLLALELCPGGETFEAWRACLTDLGTRGLVAPVWCVIDGHPGLRKAVGLVWQQALVQRCAVHKLRNLERKAPKHVLAEIRADFHRIVYADSAGAARTAFTAFERKWNPRCPGVVRSLQEGGEELLTFFQFPKHQWKTLRTTNVIERLNEEFRRRVKTQGALPTEDAALVLLFGLVVSGQIRLRRLDGWRQIPAMLRARREAAA